MKAAFFTLVGGLVGVSLLLGCSTLKMRPEGRAASDQLLTAITMQEALEALDLGDHIKGKKVAFTVTGHSTEIPYLEKSIPACLMDHGATVVAKSEEAEMLLTFVIDTAGSDQLTGGLSIPIVLPSLSTGVAVTTVDIVQREKQLGMCRLWAYATEPDQTYVFTAEPTYAEHYIKNLKIFGFSLGRSSDIEQMHDKKPVLDRLPIE